MRVQQPIIGPVATQASRILGLLRQLRIKHTIQVLGMYRPIAAAQPTHRMSTTIPAFYSSPFGLPLHSQFDPDAIAPAPGRGLDYFREAGALPEFGESALNRAPWLKDVHYWTGVIQAKQRDNPKWMKQWLETYGATAFAMLSDTQLAALLGVPVDQLCRERLHRHTLLAATLFPATLTLWRSGAVTNELYDRHLKKRNRHPTPSYQRVRQRPQRTTQAIDQRLPNHQPARPSPLRQCHTVEDEPPCLAPDSLEPSQPEIDGSAQVHA